MKTRRWVLVIALFFGFIFLVLYHGWRFFRVNDRLLHIAEGQLKQTLGDSTSIGKLELAIGAIHLKDVDLSFREGYYHLHIDDIRFGFNFFNFVRYGFQIKRIPQDIIFIKPTLSIHPIQDSEVESQPLDSTLKKLDTNLYLNKLEALESVKRITISRGKISFIDTSGNDVLLANDINGWLSTANIKRASIRLVGKIFNSGEFNLALSGHADFAAGRLDTLIARVTNYQWRLEDSFFLPSYYQIENGLINGIIKLSEKSDGRKGFDISGRLQVSDAEISFPEKNMVFEDINIDARVRDWNLYLEKAEALFNDSPIVIKGMIKNIINPQLDISISSNKFNLGNLYSALFPKWKLKLRGEADLDITLKNSFQDPFIEAILGSRSIGLNDFPLDELTLKVSYNDSVLTIDEIKVVSDQLFWQGNSNFDFSSKRRSFDYELRTEGIIPERLVPGQFPSLKGSFAKLKMEGNGKINDFSGKTSIFFRAGRDTLAFFNGFFDYVADELEIALHDNVRKCYLRAAYNFADTKNFPFIKITGLNNIIQQFAEYKKFLPYFHFKSSDLTLRKKGNEWLLSSNLIWNNNPDLSREASLWARIAKAKGKTAISGNFKIMADNVFYPGEFAIQSDSRYFKLNKFAIENLVFGELAIPRSSDSPLSGQIIFPNTSAADLARILFRESKGISEGKIYGSIGFSGIKSNPMILGKLDLSNMFLHGVGTYNGNIQFSLANRLFLINRFDLRRNEQKLITFSGTYNLADKSLDFGLTGEQIDANSFLQAFFEKENLLTGVADFDIHIKGSADVPCFTGKIEVVNGRFTRFYFDRLIFNLVDEIEFSQIDSTKLFDNSYPALRIGDFSFLRVGEFQIHGQGLIPLKRENPIDLMFSGKGNLLSILPEFTNFFKETGSDGNWHVHLRGLPGNVRLTDLRINLADGYLRLGDVAPEIKDIVLNLNLEPDGFIHVSEISGKIRRREFKFSNQRLPENPASEKFKPFEIPILDLNLGIFTIETTTKGVPLHIPGLMEKGEFGQFIFLGMNQNEKFYVTGPAWHPYVRGKLILQNMNFTFPFLSEEESQKKDNIVVRVLKSIDWDVLALTGKDLHYQRQIPSGPDNVYLDLILDAGVGSLNFKGRLADNTFGVTGQVESSRGNVEYLNLNFQVLRAGAEFDMEASENGSLEFDKSTLLPIVYGEARTTVIDSTGFPYYIYLTLLTKDSETGQTRKRGRLGEMVFQLSSENQRLGGTEGEILASLGYSTDKIKEMATDLIGISADNLLFRPLFRPFERELERTLGLDMVRFSSRFTRNLIEMNVNDERNFQINSKLFLLRSTKIMIGKYLLNQLFFSYSGQIEAGLDYRYQHEGFGLSHKFGLEYRINPSLLLEMEYDYNSLLLYRREDKRILLRHSFPF